MSEEIWDQACEDAGDELRKRVSQFDACIRAIAAELGACCGGVDGDQSDPHSTTAVLLAKIRELQGNDVTEDMELAGREWARTHDPSTFADIYKAMRAATIRPKVSLGRFVQPTWAHVGQAFIDGAREARINPDATDETFKLAADGYTKKIFERLDPESEQLLRTDGYPSVA